MRGGDCGKVMRGGDCGKVMRGGDWGKDAEREMTGVGKELRSVSVSLFQRVGAASRNDLAHECFLFVFSPNPKMLSLQTGRGVERSRLYSVVRENKFLLTLWHSLMHPLVREAEGFVLDPSGDVTVIG